MKKFIWICLAILLILGGIITGFLVTTSKQKGTEYKFVQEVAFEKDIVDDCVDEMFEMEETVSTSLAEDIKISPKATLTIKKYYTECDHTTKEYADIPINLVNKTKEGVQELYQDWEIENFSEKDISIIRNFDGKCNEHYIIRQKDGFVAVYNLDESDKEHLIEMTSISIDYLESQDIEEIENGIRVNGKEELNATLEDFE